MKKILTVVIAISIFETVVCGFSFAILITYIARCLFGLKMLGMRITMGLLLILEIGALGVHVLISILLKGDTGVLRFLMFILCAIICIAIEWYDDYTYVYVEEEE